MLLDLGKIQLTVQHQSPDLEVLHMTLLSGANSGLHRHTEERETFYVLSGEIEFVLDEQARTARAGEVVSIPIGMVHRFANTSPEPAQAVLVLNPSGLTAYFVELLHLIQHQGSREELHNLNLRYGLEFLL
jgi:quercetin dioxygenase-like cupin family protein